MIFSIIACCDKNYGIGKDNKIPWLYYKDLAFFKNKTIENTNNNKKLNIIIMGNNTYKSIHDNNKPLKNRLNIVLTNSNIDNFEKKENLLYMNNIIDILLFINNNKELYNDVYIIGGTQIYEQFLNYHIITNIYLTIIEDNEYNCDKFLNFNKYKKHFKLENTNIKFDYDQNNKNKKYKLTFNKYIYINNDENQYLNTISKVLNKGIYKLDRTKIGTKSIFGKSFKYNIRNYRLPLFTHRKIFYRGIIEELLFFISGKTNTKILEDKKINIWSGNTSREFLDSRNLNHLPEGDLGAGYSFQLRHFGAEYIDCNTNYDNQGFDQLKYIINLIKTDPTSRRILFNYWNPCAFNKTSLLPCHILYQFYINTDTNELSCSFYQRSSDFVLAANFNVVSAAILTFMLCHITGYKPGKIIHNIGDLHIYSNHIEETKKILKNQPYNFPILYINDKDKKIKNIEDFTYNDFQILFYNSHKKYSFSMAI